MPAYFNMIPFRHPPGSKQLADKKAARQDRVIASATAAMEMAMRGAVEYIMHHWEKTGRYAEPSLASMDGIMVGFYRHVIHEAYHSATDERKWIRRDKTPPNQTLIHMAAGSKWPIGIPKHLTGLEKIFRDRRYWPKVMKRSQIITDRVRKQYLRKLQIKFTALLPRLDANEITPKEAKSALMQSWTASKPRVELIFRTETTTYFGKTQVAFFEGDPEIIGFLFDSIRDMGRTDWCRTRHGLIYRPGTKLLTQNTPSCHWNCRSHLIPLANTPYNRKLLSDPQRNPAIRKVAPLPNGWRK